MMLLMIENEVSIERNNDISNRMLDALLYVQDALFVCIGILGG